jgi:hypothetical protein
MTDTKVENYLIHPDEVCSLLDEIHPGLGLTESSRDFIYKLLLEILDKIDKEESVEAGIKKVVPEELHRYVTSNYERSVDKEHYDFDPNNFSEIRGYSEEDSKTISCLCAYLTAEIMELAGNVTMKKEKDFITVSHIKTAIQGDNELAKLFPIKIVPEIQLKKKTTLRNQAKKSIVKVLSELDEDCINHIFEIMKTCETPVELLEKMK